MGASDLNRQTASPFAAVAGLAVAVTPEQQVRIAAFSSPDLTDADYRNFDLPLRVGALSAAQRQAFAPDSGLGRFEFSATGAIENYCVKTRADFALVAFALLDDRSGLRAGSRHDLALTRFQPFEEGAVARRVKDQIDIVADILEVDRALVGGQKVSVHVEFVQDRPSPWQALARPMHTDGMGIPGPLHRSYLVRSVHPPEFIRDRIVNTPMAQEPIYQALKRGEVVHDTILNPWLAKAKAAGMAVVPNPYEVMLMSRQKTMHRSQVPERPELVVPSTYLRVMVAPCQY